MPPPYALLACDVFSEELRELGGDTPPWHSISFLEMGLHDRPDELRARTQACIGDLESDPQVEVVALAYGRCGNGLLGIRAGRCPLILPQAHDCIAILLGGCRAHAAVLKENPATFFYSPGWMRQKRVPGPGREAYLRELYSQRHADDDELVEDLIEADKETFAHHNCAAYVSIIDRPESENYCRDCAHHLGWQYRQLASDPSMLQDLLQGGWASRRFLHVAPGQCIGADADGSLIAHP